MSFSDDAVFSDVDCMSTSSAALFGCIDGNDGRPIGAYGDFRTSGILDFAIGHQWHNGFRTEMVITYRPNFKFDGESNFIQLDPGVQQDVAAFMDNLSAMIVAEVRPLDLMGRTTVTVDPFVVAGVGIARNEIDAMMYIFPDTETITPDGSHTGFAWTVGCGIARKLANGVELSFAYRYVDLGTVQTGVDTMWIVDRESGDIINDSITIGGTKADLTVSEFVVSLCWHF